VRRKNSISANKLKAWQLLDVVKEWVTDDAERIKDEVVFVKCNQCRYEQVGAVNYSQLAQTHFELVGKPERIVCSRATRNGTPPSSCVHCWLLCSGCDALCKLPCHSAY
jgi:hypothetical protein